MIDTHGMTSRLQKAGTYATIAACFFTPLSTSLMGGFAALAMVCWLASGRFLRTPQLVRESLLATASFVLLLLFVTGMFYSPVPWEEIIDGFKKYRELLYIPAVLALLWEEDDRLRAHAVNAFFWGCIILMTISFAMAAGFLPGERYGSSITYHITHSFFMAILAFWTAHRLVTASSRRVAWCLLLAAVLANILYVAPGRTGMITLLALSLLFIWQRFSWRKQVAAYLICAALIGTGIYSSENVRQRMELAVTDIRTYEHGTSRSSLGMRFDWWYGSLQLVREKPLFGHGTGSFTAAHDRLITNTEVRPTDNPHNEYLFIAVQLGTVGLLAFLFLFVAGWLDARHKPAQTRYMAQGVIVSMMIGCLANSFLFDSHQGHYFALLLGVLCAPFQPEEHGSPDR